MQSLPRKKCLRCGTINEYSALTCSNCRRRLFGATIELVDTTEVSPGHTYTGLDDDMPIRRPVEITAGSGNATTPLPESNLPDPTTQRLDNTAVSAVELLSPPSHKPIRERANPVGILLFSGIVLLLIVLTIINYILNGHNPPAHPGIPVLPNGIGTVQFPNGEYVGVNDGTYHPFDLERADPQNLRQLAMNALQPGSAGSDQAILLWNRYLQGDNTNDAEIQIYLQNQYVKTSHIPYVTLIVGLDFPDPHQTTDPSAISATHSALQGICVAQREFNDQHSNIKLRLLLSNTGDNTNYVAPVANQITRIVRQDKTVIGILGWQTSARTGSILQDLLQNKIDIPMVSETASSDYLTQDTPHNFFRIIPPNSVEAQAAVAQAKKLGATQAIVFMDPQDPYSQNLGMDFEGDIQNYKSGYIEKDFTVEHTNTTAFSAKLQDALKGVKDPNHVVVFFTGTTNYDVAQFQDALADYPSIPVIAGDAGYVALKPSYGRWYMVAYAFHGYNSYAPFFQEYSNAFDPNGQHPGYGYQIPDSVAIVSYDTLGLFSYSIDQSYPASAGQITPQEIENNLLQIQGTHAWQGVSGQIAFDARHNPIDKALIILQIDAHGRFQMVCMQGTFSKNANNAIPAC